MYSTVDVEILNSRTLYFCPASFVMFSTFVFVVSRLEKEYTRAKHKEAEDNEEIRRQRTENRLLMQRVEHLEKVQG